MGISWKADLYIPITSIFRLIMFLFKKLAIVVTASFFLACTAATPEISKTPETNTRDQSGRVADTVAGHSVDKEREKDDERKAAASEDQSTGKRKWSRSGTPIDTTNFDRAIQDAEKSYKAKSDDAGLKKKLGTAYFERGVALTAARQYASAIGDFRKAVNYDPANEEAKKQIEVISSIYESMNIESPKIGEEPASLEFKKEKD